MSSIELNVLREVGHFRAVSYGDGGPEGSLAAAAALRRLSAVVIAKAGHLPLTCAAEADTPHWFREDPTGLR